MTSYRILAGCRVERTEGGSLLVDVGKETVELTAADLDRLGEFLRTGREPEPTEEEKAKAERGRKFREFLDGLLLGRKGE